ncbi:MAG TPA: hypothetical protein VGG03_14350 [Thermoanaerobaculia bacterium]|jgi:hypothetical protein
MFQPKLRRALASTALVSVLALLPVRSVSAEPRDRSGRKGRDVSSRFESFSPWRLLIAVLEKAGVMIDPEGNS